MTEDNIVWWAFSLIVGLGSVPVAFGIVLLCEHIKRNLRQSNGSSVIHIGCASAGSDFVPLIGGLGKGPNRFEDCQLWLFGCDGRYIINKKGRRWHRVFRKWTKGGLVIKYILLEIDDEVKSELGRLKRALGKDLGKNFDVLMLEHNDETREIARKLETFHPTLFLGRGDDRAAWIEGLHRKNSVFAYNVDYISPCVIQSSRAQRKRLELYERDLEFVCDNSTAVFA